MASSRIYKKQVYHIETHWIDRGPWCSCTKLGYVANSNPTVIIIYVWLSRTAHYARLETNDKKRLPWNFKKILLLVKFGMFFFSLFFLFSLFYFQDLSLDIFIIFFLFWEMLQEEITWDFGKFFVDKIWNFHFGGKLVTRRD